MRESKVELYLVCSVAAGGNKWNRPVVKMLLAQTEYNWLTVTPLLDLPFRLAEWMADWVDGWLREKR